MRKKCYNCGSLTKYNSITPVDADLISTWGISTSLARLFNTREGKLCSRCGANIRAQGLAKAILESRYGFGASNLKEWVAVANEKKLSVCELNSCHQLHETLNKLNSLTYSEYGTDSEQNIEALTYKDNSFDMVLHSETLEHVTEPLQAMNECRRVIKDDGLVLFTTPVVWNRQTRRRASYNGGEINYLLEPSYHGKRTDDYLVFFEYGSDIDDYTGASVCLADPFRQNFVFASNKQPSTISSDVRNSLQSKQRVAQIIRVIL